MAKLKHNRMLWLVVPFLMVAQLTATGLYIWKYRPQKILVNWVVPQGVVIRILSLLFRKVDYVIVVHGGDAALANRNILTKFISRWVLNRSTHVVPVSRYIRERLDHLIAPDTPVHIISMGVWPLAFSADKNIDVIFVGRIERKKGLVYLLNALEKIIRSGREVSAYIIGDGTLREELEHYMISLGLSDSVKFVGAKPNKVTISMMAKSRVFVLPSINLSDDVEGMPTVVLEAMSQHAAVVATDAGGTSDVVKNGETGILVPQGDSDAIADAILNFLDDEDLYRKVTGNARQLVEKHFSYQSIGYKFSEVLRG